VALLAAQGLKNPEIAEQLLMGRETVKTHLARVYRKLDVANRAELAALVARLDQDGSQRSSQDWKTTTSQSS
jgi:DNA-binding CsgD family transcriptional regulator